MKQIARTNEWYQPEEVGRVIGKMSARKGKQNTTALKYSGVVPYLGKHTDKVIKPCQKTGYEALRKKKKRNPSRETDCQNRWVVPARRGRPSHLENVGKEGQTAYDSFEVLRSCTIRGKAH